MKPDWKDAPEWAKHLAMDGDGEWYWYSHLPESYARGNCWLMHSTEIDARSQYAGTQTTNWLETLERRP